LTSRQWLQRKAKRHRRATGDGAVFFQPSSYGGHPFTNARKAEIAAGHTLIQVFDLAKNRGETPNYFHGRLSRVIRRPPRL
jgi:hypothetical protein